MVWQAIAGGIDWHGWVVWIRIRATETDTGYSVDSVAQTISIRIRVQWLSTVRNLVKVTCSITIIIQVFSQTRRSADGIVVTIVIGWERIWRTITIAVFKHFNGEIPRVGVSVRVVGINCVGDVACGFSWNTHQVTVVWIDGQAVW